MYNNYNPYMYQQQIPYQQQTQNSFPVTQPVTQAPMTNTNTINGRFVNDFNEIKADEIPMNGSKSVFIKGDLSEVAVKCWNNNGTIDTSIYQLKQEEQPKIDVFTRVDLELLEEKISKLETRFNRIEKSIKENIKWWIKI